MITEQDLLEAIAECQGQRNPNANTCIKLAAYYTILNNLQATAEKNSVVVSKKETPTYSYAPPDNSETTVNYQSDSEFSKLIGGKSAVKIWAVMDELMSAVSLFNVKLYNDVMRKLNEI